MGRRGIQEELLPKHFLAEEIRTRVEQLPLSCLSVYGPPRTPPLRRQEFHGLLARGKASLSGLPTRGIQFQPPSPSENGWGSDQGHFERGDEGNLTAKGQKTDGQNWICDS